jgi:mono/diheme cytochrome c family protein
MRKVLTSRLTCLCVGLAISTVAARLEAADDSAKAPADDSVSYFKQVRPILQANCQGCHQPAKAGGGYVMTSFDGLLKGGESQVEAIVPGKPEESELLEQITPRTTRRRTRSRGSIPITRPFTPGRP